MTTCDQPWPTHVAISYAGRNNYVWSDLNSARHTASYDSLLIVRLTLCQVCLCPRTAESRTVRPVPAASPRQPCTLTGCLLVAELGGGRHGWTRDGTGRDKTGLDCVFWPCPALKIWDLYTGYLLGYSLMGKLCQPTTSN